MSNDIEQMERQAASLSEELVRARAHVVQIESALFQLQQSIQSAREARDVHNLMVEEGIIVHPDNADDNTEKEERVVESEGGANNNKKRINRSYKDRPEKVRMVM